MKKIIATGLLLTSAALLLAGCADTDVVLKYAPGSFRKIVDTYPDLVTDNTREYHYYNFTVDGETTLKISNDFSLTGANDLMIETPLKPFTDAGLDAAKLTGGFMVDGDMLYLTVDDGNGTGKKNTVTDSLFEAVTASRANLTYHQKLDHYGIKLTQGKFEWAKDYTKNDKDIVFVIYAKPLIDLGVNVNTIKGWSFMTVENPDGTSTDVVVKPYDLKSK